MRFLKTLLVVIVALGGAIYGGRYWIAQDSARCGLVPDYSQVLLCTPEMIASLAYKKGRFEGTLDVRFMSVRSGDGHPIEMVQLLKPFTYVDSRGKQWEVPEGFISDGASIPTNLWAIVGGPYSGPYRDAAVIHDYYCYRKNRPWESVHEVFLEASLNRGTPEWTARYMYAGVLLKGPRWPAPQAAELKSGFSLGEWLVPSARAQTTPTPPPAAPAPSAVGKTDAQIFEELRVWIEKEKPSLDQIRKRVEELRQVRTPVKK